MVFGTLKSIVKNIQDNREHKREQQEEVKRKEIINQALKDESFIEFLVEHGSEFSADDIFKLDYEPNKQKQLISRFEAFKKTEIVNQDLKETFQQALTRETVGFANRQGANLTSEFKNFLSKEVKGEAWNNPEHILEIEKTLAEHTNLLKQVEELEKKLVEINPKTSSETRNLQAKMDEARKQNFDTTHFGKEISDLTLAQRKLIEPIKEHFQQKEISDPHQIVKLLKSEARQLLKEATSRSQTEAQITELRKQLDNISKALLTGMNLSKRFEKAVAEQLDAKLTSLEEAAKKGNLESAEEALKIFEDIGTGKSEVIPKKELLVGGTERGSTTFQTLAANNFKKALKTKIRNLKNSSPTQIDKELSPFLLREKVGNLKGSALESFIQESLKSAYAGIKDPSKKLKLSIYLYRNNIRI